MKSCWNGPVSLLCRSPARGWLQVATALRLRYACQFAVALVAACGMGCMPCGAVRHGSRSPNDAGATPAAGTTIDRASNAQILRSYSRCSMRIHWEIDLFVDGTWRWRQWRLGGRQRNDPGTRLDRGRWRTRADGALLLNSMHGRELVCPIDGGELLIPDQNGGFLAWKPGTCFD